MHSSSLILELAMVTILSLILVWYFSGEGVGADVKLSVALSWIFGFTGIFLLPFDVAQSFETDSASALRNGWIILYDLTFCLSWVILPIQHEFHCSGHFTFGDKFKDALKKTCKYYSIILVGCVAYILYMAASEDANIADVYSVLMALGNSYGVLLLVALAGSGLVSLPRAAYYAADKERSLKQVYISIVRHETVVLEARRDLEEIENVVNGLDESTEPVADAQHILYLQQSLTVFRSTTGICEARKHQSNSELASKCNTAPSYDDLVEIHVQLKRIQAKALACELHWQQLQEKAEVLEKEVAEKDRLHNMHTDGDNKKCRCSWEYLAEWLHLHKGKLLKFVAICLMALSLLIFWCEMLIPMSVSSPLGYVLDSYDKNDSRSAMKIQVYTSLILFYLSACAYYTLFSIDLGWEYSLKGPQRSPFSALIFNGEYATRLQFALCFNLIMIIRTNSGGNSTMFEGIMERMRTAEVLNTSVSTYVPLFMVLFAFLSYFQLYERCLNMIPGWELDSYVANQDEEVELLKTGRMLLNHEKRTRKRQIEDKHQKCPKAKSKVHILLRNALSGMKVESVTQPHYEHLASTSSHELSEDDGQDVMNPISDPNEVEMFSGAGRYSNI